MSLFGQAESSWVLFLVVESPREPSRCTLIIVRLEPLRASSLAFAVLSSGCSRTSRFCSLLPRDIGGRVCAYRRFSTAFSDRIRATTPVQQRNELNHNQAFSRSLVPPTCGLLLEKVPRRALLREAAGGLLSKRYQALPTVSARVTRTFLGRDPNRHRMTPNNLKNAPDPRPCARQPALAPGLGQECSLECQVLSG